METILNLSKVTTFKAVILNLSQDLVQAAAQIQDLLTQLQTEGATTETAQQQVATDLASAAKANPTMMDKLAGWGQTLT